MSVTTTQAETRLAMLLDERQLILEKSEALRASINAREDHVPNETENEQLLMYRERSVEIDAETDLLAGEIEGTKAAIANAAKLRRAMAGTGEDVDVGKDGELVYRTFAAYARDAILTRGGNECAKIAKQLGDPDQVFKARERLQLLARVDDTLSSDVGGLTPPQHIAQIFQIIDASRPLVASATKADLVRGQLTYPHVLQRPVVSEQADEKTEAGNQTMKVELLTTTAEVFLGGGDLSWQAINWSTPNALDLWFQLAAADYALKTETDAAGEVTNSAHHHGIATKLTSTPDFTTFMAAVGAGAGKVYADSLRMADTVYMSPDRYWYLFGLTSTPTAVFVTVSGQSVGPLSFVPSRGLDAGTIIVGDSEALLVAETPGAPVELRVVEPAIGGLEVGIIGGFESVVVDDGAFALITATS
jgi:HK97 family phage major capsid protein